VLPAGLYQVASNDRAYIYEEPGGSLEALYDVQSGNNDYAPSGYLGGLFPAAPGYDMASGLGTPLLGGLSASGHASNFYPGLAALMCYQYSTRLRTTRITKVSPAAGPAGRAVAVVITGSGFLPVAGADELAAGRETVVASCPTTSLCRAVLPAGRPGTVNLRMLGEDLAVSPVVSGDRFRFAAPPSITGLKPSRGARTGGTRVEIVGHNLAGATSVHFGPRLAGHLKLVSPTELLVTSPPGSGRVVVRVTTAGGTSVRSPGSLFTY
jgi:hypothetical protein